MLDCNMNVSNNVIYSALCMLLPDMKLSKRFFTISRKKEKYYECNKCIN